MSGWIRLHRRMREWQHYQENSVKAVFIDLLLSVSFEESWYKSVKIEPGCTPMSITAIEQHTGLSRKSVIHALKVLEGTGEITRARTNNGCITRITNFAEYQSGVPSGGIITPVTETSSVPSGVPSGGIITPIIRNKEDKNIGVVVCARETGLNELRDEMLSQGNVERLCMTYKVSPQQVADITDEIIADWEISQEQDTSRKHFLNTFRIKARAAASTATRPKSKEQQRMETLAFMTKAFTNTQTIDNNGNSTEQ